MDYRWLDNIEPHSALIVPTRSLQSHLLEQFGLAQIDAGRQAWLTPNILCWTDYLHLIWQQNQAVITEYFGFRRLLNPPQTALIWQQVIRSTKITDDALWLLNDKQTARSAAKSWQLCHDWQLSLSVLQHKDATQFANWAQQFKQRLQQSQQIDMAGLSEQMLQLAQQDKLQFPFKTVYWYAIDLLSDLQSLFQQVSSTAGVVNETLPIVELHKQTDYFCYADAEMELRSVLLAARELVEREPQSCINIVIPDLSNRLAQVRRIAAQIFYPVSSPQTLRQQPLAYRFSLGEPLAQWSAIKALLALLQLSGAQISSQAFAGLFESCFLRGFSDHADSLTHWTHFLHKQAISKIVLQDLQDLLNAYAQQHDEQSDFLACLQRIAQWHGQTQRQNIASHEEWLKHIDALIELADWRLTTKEASLDSIAWQLDKKWQVTRQVFLSFSAVQPNLRFQQAIEQLTTLCWETIFLPQADPAPIVISGLYEAVGRQATHSFVLGLDDTFAQLPARDPFVGGLLQEHPRFPGASAIAHTRQLRCLLDSLKQSSKQVVYSFAERHGSEKRTACALFAADLFIKQKTDKKMEQSGLPLECFQDLYGLPLKQPAQITGGVGYFEDQSNCAFRSYAKRRIQYRRIEEVSFGLAPALRGRVIHKALELFWQQVQTSDHLLHLMESPDKLQSQLADCLSHAIDQQAANHGQQQRTLLRLEQGSLLELLEDWLQIESQRVPFTVIELEQRRQGEINKLQFHYSVDRVDQLQEDGAQIVIDYKTGSASRKQMLGQRIEKPQLPIYVNQLNQQPSRHIVGAAFARLKKTAIGFVELAEVNAFNRSAHWAEKYQQHWQDGQQQWPDYLSELAEQIVHGDAQVNPIEQNTCKYCDLHSFCRINELTSMTNRAAT